MKHDCDPPPEFLLVAACCRWPPSDRRDAAVREAARAVVDWRRFVRVVNRQRVAGLVQPALKAATIALPPDVAAELAQSAQQIAVQNVQSAGESARLQTIFDEAHIPIVFFKGVSLAQLAYGSLSLKHSKDIDFLVLPEHAESALRILEQNGYALVKPAEHLSRMQRLAYMRHAKEFELLNRTPNIRVELHWHLTDNPLLLKGVDARSPARNVVTSGGLPLRTLCEEELFAYLCAHGAVHSWARLKWLADVNALIANRDDTEIERLFHAAEARGAGLCAGQALLLCDRFWGLKLPPKVEAALKKNRRLERLVSTALIAMIGTDAETEILDDRRMQRRIYLTQYLLGRGLSYFAAQCRIAIVHPEDAVQYPLPLLLDFLYPALRLPSWIWRHASGIVASSVARKEA